MPEAQTPLAAEDGVTQLKVIHHGNTRLAQNMTLATHTLVDGMQLGTEWTRMTIPTRNVQAVRSQLHDLGIPEVDMQVLGQRRVGGQEKIG